jgi:excisionase family DNA binding protein
MIREIVLEAYRSGSWQTSSDDYGGGGMDQLLIKPEEAAKAISVSRSTFYEMLARREIESISIGRSRRIPVAALRHWVETQASRQHQDAAAKVNKVNQDTERATT